MMAVYTFTLIVDGPDLQSEANSAALFEAGCDDALVGRAGTLQYIDFDREARSLSDAVFTATESIERAVSGATVVHLEPDDLVSMTEIAERTERTRESIRLLISGERGPGGFPPAATHFKTRNRMWEWHAVAQWFTRSLNDERLAASAGDSNFIAAFNAGLRLRRANQALSDDDRDRIERLAARSA